MAQGRPLGIVALLNDLKAAPRSRWRELAESDNREERIAGRILLRHADQKERLAERVRGGPRPPWTRELTDAEQYRQYQTLMADPNGLIELVRQYGAEDVVRWWEQMQQIEARLRGDEAPPTKRPGRGSRPAAEAAPDRTTVSYVAGGGY